MTVNSLPSASPSGASGMYLPCSKEIESNSGVSAPSALIVSLFAAQWTMKSPAVTGVPSDHLASSLMVYFTVSGSSEVFSYVPKSSFGMIEPSVPKYQKDENMRSATAELYVVYVFDCEPL